MYGVRSVNFEPRSQINAPELELYAATMGRMTVEYYPLQVLLLTFSGWVNREQQRTIEYLVEENRILKEQLESRKLRGVVARFKMEPELPHHALLHVLIAFDTGRPSSYNWFSTLQASNASALWDFGLRARSRSPMIDL